MITTLIAVQCSNNQYNHDTQWASTKSKRDKSIHNRTKGKVWRKEQRHNIFMWFTDINCQYIICKVGSDQCCLSNMLQYVKAAWPRPVVMLYYVSSSEITPWISQCLSVSSWLVCLSQSLRLHLSHSVLLLMSWWELLQLGHHVHCVVFVELVRASALHSFRSC